MDNATESRTSIRMVDAPEQPAPEGTVCADHEIIAGYTLHERIGAGGFGEVWSATAPGGLQKAVKIVYGQVSGRQATSELKAMERIRDVRHPFILTLERIDVVDERLV